MFAFTPVSKRRFFTSESASPDVPSWDDKTDRATRRAAWKRQQSERRSSYARRQTLGVVGAVALLMIAMLSMAPASHVFERAADAQTAQVESAPQVDAADDAPRVDPTSA